MTLENVKDLKNKFFRCEAKSPDGFLYIEDVIIYDFDDKYVAELRITSINCNTIDERRKLESYGADRHLKITDQSITSPQVLMFYWNFKNVIEISKDEFKKEMFAYIDETCNRIFGETPN